LSLRRKRLSWTCRAVRNTNSNQTCEPCEVSPRDLFSREMHFGQRCVEVLEISRREHGRPQGGKRAFSPLEIEPKNGNVLENMKSVAQFWFDLILATTVYLPVRHSHSTKVSSRSWCHSAVSLQFTRVHFFACPILGADSSGVGLYYATISWFTSSYDCRRFAGCCC